VIQTFWK